MEKNEDKIQQQVNKWCEKIPKILNKTWLTWNFKLVRNTAVVVTTYTQNVRNERIFSLCLNEYFMSLTSLSLHKDTFTKLSWDLRFIWCLMSLSVWGNWSHAADVNKPDLNFNWQQNANIVRMRRCFDVSERSWRKSKSRAAATGLKGTSVLMIHNVYGDKVRVL